MSKASHPSYYQMIKEALVALNEKNGSSPHAIAKFISQKHKNLPSNFNKMLGVQLKNCTANGKLTKVKSSFKLSDASKQVKPTKSAPAKPTKVVPKAKKPAPVKASHPTYFQMIKEAILALKERSGSSPYAIAKYMEEKHSKILPANFKKLLAVQLKNCVANGKLIKMKASFKLSDASKKDVKAVPKPVASKKKPATKPKAAAVAVKAKAGKKPASTAAPTKKKPAAGVAKKAASKKPAGVVAKKAAGSKKPAGAVAKKAGVKKKTKAATPIKPKSVRSPAAKRARRG